MEPRPHGILGRLSAAFRQGQAKPPAPSKDAEHAPPSATMPPGMLNLRRLRVEDVAVPKAEIIAVPTDIRKDDLVDVFRESGLTRLPIYKGTLDSPIGLVHLKDLALRHGFNGAANKGGKSTRFSLLKMARPLLYAPPSMPIGVLLQKMQTSRIHMALVIDEYGGVDGLVTLEDLIEQVLGEIEDEHDIDEGAFWVQEKPGCYLVQARAPLDEFEAEIGMRLRETSDEDEIDTMGGLVFLLTGRVPTRGEVIQHPSGLEIDVVDADPRHIKRLRVRLNGAKRG
jgi:magnesium and cobalt transporter